LDSFIARKISDFFNASFPQILLLAATPASKKRNIFRPADGGQKSLFLGPPFLLWLYFAKSSCNFATVPIFIRWIAASFSNKLL